MPSTKDVKLGERLMCLFVGENGCGKTVAAASFPLPMKIYDFDGRMKPIKLMYPDKDITYETYGPKNMTEFIEEFNGLGQFCKYRTIVIDSMTSLSISLINFQLKHRPAGKGKSLPGNIQTTGWDEINGETITFSQMLDICKTLPCHVILTAHPISRTELIDGIAKRSRSLVAYGNKVGSIVPGYFDEIYNFSKQAPINIKDTAKFIVSTQNVGEEMGKSALPLPSVIDITRTINGEEETFYEILQRLVVEHGIKLEGGTGEPIRQIPTITSKLVSF
jgi:hypothetical protein